MRRLIALVPLVIVVGCLDLDRDVPAGFPALKFGDGAHGIWEHGGKAEDVIAEIGIIDVDGPGVLIKGEEDHPSLLLKFLDGLEAGEFTSPGDEPMVIATKEDESLFGDNFPGSSVTLVVEEADDELFVGSVEGTVCTFDEEASEEVCEPLEGKWTAIDDRDLQD
jgi:hypothetical protein